MTRVSGRIVRPGAVVAGHVEIDGTTILSVDAARTGEPDLIVPGFVDLHCHGGGGHTFTTGSAAEARRRPSSTGGTAPPRCWPAWSAHRSN